MTTFRYRAYSAIGDLLEGEIEARTSDEAEETLWRRGLTPFETREIRAKSSSASSFRLFGRGGPSAAELASFTREFATLEQADIPLDHGLRILATQSASQTLRDLAQEILRHVVDGASLSDALSKRADVFAGDFINVVRAGESMGNAAQALGDMADMLERRLEVRARIQSGLVYPALLIVLAIISTGIVVGTLVPNIAPIFADNGRPMPAGLQFIIDLESNWRLIAAFIGAVAVALFGLGRLAASRPQLRETLDRYVLRVPYIGPLKSQHETARFARTLGSLLRAGVPLLQGLESARSVIANRYLSARIEQVLEAVRGGASLSAALAPVERLPSVATQMISIGEEVGKLDEMLLRLAIMFERQTQRSIERALSLVTPVLTILIAAVVGGLIMTVMDAVLGINELATR
jgi:general secretion pathway protein F